MKLLPVQHLAFAVMSKKDLDKWQDTKKLWPENFKAVKTTFISRGTLLEKAVAREKHLKYSPCLVWQGMPGFMSLSWINEHKSFKKRMNSYKFATGLYKQSDGFLLVDDLFEWVHGQRKKEDVRSAFDIILAIQAGELEL